MKLVTLNSLNNLHFFILLVNTAGTNGVKKNNRNTCIGNQLSKYATEDKVLRAQTQAGSFVLYDVM